MADNTPTVPDDFDIAAYWQFRMSQTSLDHTGPDDSLATFLALTSNPAPEVLMEAATSSLAAYLSKAREFNVGTSDQQVIVLCDGENTTRADLALLALFGQANPTGTKTWIDVNGKATVLTGTQLVNLASLAGSWITDCYGALADINSKITQANPTITTTSQINNYVWPTS